MKLCFISNLYPPDIMGGAELYVEKVVKKLAENFTNPPTGGKENYIIVITANQKFSWQPIIEEKENIKIYRIWPVNFYSLTTKKQYPVFLKMLWHLLDIWNPFVYFAVKKILKKERPDLVHTHNLASLSFSIFNAIKSQKIKTIHTCHDYYLLCPYANLVCPLTPLDGKHLTGQANWKSCTKLIFPCRLYRQITQHILKNKIDIILTPSKFVMETHLKNGFFTNSQQIILPLGIENNIGVYHDRGKRLYSNLNILCVSQLAPHKGVGVLIEAYKLLLSTYPDPSRGPDSGRDYFLNSKLYVIGDGAERKNLEKLAANNKNIVFLGQLSHEEVQKKYQEADVVVIPSLAPETFSLVMFEAMANGKLVIASKIGALAEYIKDNETGFLFEPGNVNQLKELLEKVINNPDLIKKIGQNAQQFAQDFTFQKHWEKLEEIYKKLL